jgi:hypothetical protein
VIKSRIIRLVGHVTRTRERIGTYRDLLGKRDHFEELGVDGRIILKLVFR